MKKFLVIFLFIISVTGVANAQFTKIGGGIGYTSGIAFHRQSIDYNQSSKLGGFIKSIYEVSPAFVISPSFSYLLPRAFKVPPFAGEERKVTVNVFMFDINGHYILNSPDRFEFYGLAGLDILFAIKKDVIKRTSFSNTISENDNAMGLNLGLGTYMKLTEQTGFLQKSNILSVSTGSLWQMQESL